MRTATTHAPVAPSIQRRVFSESTLRPTEYDLSESGVGFHQLVRGTDLVEGEHTIDDGLELTGVEERHNALGEVSRQRDFFFGIPAAQHRPDNSEPLLKQRTEVERSARPSSQTDHNDSAAQRQHPQVALEIIPSYQIHHRM